MADTFIPSGGSSGPAEWQDEEDCGCDKEHPFGLKFEDTLAAIAAGQRARRPRPAPAPTGVGRRRSRRLARGAK